MYNCISIYCGSFEDHILSTAAWLYAQISRLRESRVLLFQRLALFCAQTRTGLGSGVGAVTPDACLEHAQAAEAERSTTAVMSQVRPATSSL